MCIGRMGHLVSGLSCRMLAHLAVAAFLRQVKAVQSIEDHYHLLSLKIVAGKDIEHEAIDGPSSRG